MNYEALDKDIIQGEDGYWLWWPERNVGAHNENSLQTILQILSFLNKEVSITYALSL